MSPALSSPREPEEVSAAERGLFFLWRGKNSSKTIRPRAPSPFVPKRDKGRSMVHLTRLNHVPLVVNSDLIEHIEVTPDTVIVLTTGQKFLVRETADEVIERVLQFRQSLLAPWFDQFEGRVVYPFKPLIAGPEYTSTSEEANGR